MNTEPILRTEHLKKTFGQVQAVADVSLNVQRGEVFGFLGPNGAGKTTTIGMVLSLIYPTSGRIWLMGEPLTPASNATLRRTGALVGSPALVPYLSARQNIELLARLHPGLSKARMGKVLELVGLQADAHRKAGDFSTGMKQRLGLAMALLHEPELLVLDEPTNGMDPNGMREMRQLLRHLVDEGVTVFLSSHLLHEVEQVCDRVAVLNKGRVVAEGPVAELLSGPKAVKVRVPSPAEAAALLLTLPEATGIQPNGAYLTVKGVTSEAVVAHLARHGVFPSEVTSAQADLESLFIELTTGPEAVH